MFRSLQRAFTWPTPPNEPLKREVSTHYNIVTRSHTAIITPFVPGIKISLVLNENCPHQAEDLEIRISDESDAPVKPAFKAISPAAGKVIFIYLQNCDIGKPYEIAISLREPGDKFETCDFKIYQEKL